jgi:hypothetical protein
MTRQVRAFPSTEIFENAFVTETDPLTVTFVQLTNKFVVPKPVLDILAEMIAADTELNVGPFSTGPASDRGLD